MKRYLTLCLSLLTAVVLAADPQSANKSSGSPAVEAKPLSKPKTPDVVFVPTPQEAVDRMLELAEIKPGDVLYDLGCGDGRIVVTAAKRYGIKAVGFDVDPKRVEESKKRVRDNGVEHLVNIVQADIFEQDLSPASVVTLYLLPSLNVKLIPQLQKLKSGSRIVSYSFDMAGAKPDLVDRRGYHTIYKWSTPLRLEGEKAPPADASTNASRPPRTAASK